HGRPIAQAPAGESERPSSHGEGRPQPIPGPGPPLLLPGPEQSDRGLRLWGLRSKRVRGGTGFLKRENTFSHHLSDLDSPSPLPQGKRAGVRDHITVPPLPEDGPAHRKWAWQDGGVSDGPRLLRARVLVLVSVRVPVTDPPRRRLRWKEPGDRTRRQHSLSSKMNYMPGTASLIEDIDKKHLVLLRDGRTLIGFLRSIDQFANLVLHQTVERIHVGKKYGDIPRGIFVVRGENVVLLGEIDLEKESDTPLQQVSIEEILEEQRVEQQTKLEAEKLKVQALKDRGLSIPRADTLDEY
ncbi:U6 snRNA-associated Sm-like protein LSm1, partial [Tamandua tetradactyla]|uniref:U6 snRNA-associated Sm-like protein LSm1 n=1 Tax=Tamandua tetradactyla TaxID=48850 RepID=UPI004053B3B7